jgi:glucokinase
MMVASKPPACLAVDIGGTKIALGVFGLDGQARGEVTQATVLFGENGRADAQALIGMIWARAEEARTQGVELCGLGLSICGNVNMENGNCSLIPNLHWRDVPFGKMAAEATGLPVFAATDTRMAALAEHVWGAAQGVDHFCWCTVGTGYGGYLYLDGKPFDGFHGIAGPFGHNTIDEVNGYLCGCGRRGCVETYVAGPAIARAGQAAVQAGEAPLLALLAGDAPVTTHMVVQAYRQQDQAAVKIIDEVVRMIAISLSGVNNLLDLEMFILGGGVIHALPELVGLVGERIRGYLMSAEAKRDLLIVQESFPNSSLVGAAAYAFVKLGLLYDEDQAQNQLKHEESHNVEFIHRTIQGEKK